MNRKAFRQLLKKYLDNSCTEEEKRIVDQWYELLEYDPAALSDVEITEMEDRLWDKIHPVSELNIDAKAQKMRIRPWRKYLAAASFVGVALIAGFIWLRHREKLPPAVSLVTVKINQGFLKEANNSDVVKTMALDDGSTVSIYPGSTLAYPEHFAPNKREVYLEGEAFFTVSKNPSRPFFVYNNQIITQVLGTSFEIRRKNGHVEVAVKTGKVAVYENEEQIRLSETEQKSNGVIITPNQKVTYFREERHFITSIVDQPAPVHKESDHDIAENRFNYNEAPLRKVLNDLQNIYELEIVLENEKIEKCLFTGDLTGQDLFNKLKSICLVFYASYEIKGTKILLKGGKDCSENRLPI